MARRSNRRPTRREEVVTSPSRPLNGRPVQNVGRSAIAVRQAQMRLVNDLSPVSVTSKPSRQLVARPVASSPVLGQAAPARKRESRDPVQQAQPLRMDKETRLCKSRPRSSRGAGGSRPFVPWCS